MYTPHTHTHTRSNTAAIVVFQVSLSEDIHNLWLAVVDSEAATVQQETPESKTALTSTAPQLPVKSGTFPPNPLPRNKEVVMFLEKADL